ncbi:MAG: SDR family oxidoreductase [Myxococcota bacterium]
MDPILVTGATGNVGREVVAALRRRGIPVRTATQDVARLAERFGDDVEAVALDFRDASTFGRAIEGCEGVFLLRPPAIANVKKTLNPFVDAARTSGVRHVVFLSVAGAGDNALVPHHHVEAHLAARGRDWTVLRPGFFAQNLQDAYRRDILDDDRLYVPAGDGRVAFVDVRDVAEVAARVFADPASHAGRAYTLTGPETCTFAETAALLTEVLGRPIRYEPASVLGYVRHLRRRGLPWGQAAVQAILHVGLRFGQAATVDPTLEALLGRPGRTLRQYVQDHAALWRLRPSRSAASP